MADRRLRHHLSQDEMNRGIGMLHSGLSQIYVANVLGVSQSVVSRMWNRFITTGNVRHLHAGGREGSTNEVQDRFLVVQARRHRFDNATALRRDFQKVDRICGVWLSLCVCVRLASRVGRLVSRLRASVSRASCVCLRLFTSRVSNACVCLACVCVCLRRSSCLASVSHLSRVCLRRSSCLASVSRRSSCLASVVLSRVGRLVSRRSSCLASVSRLASVCPCECLRELAHFMRRSSFKRFLLSSYYLIMSQCQSIHPIT